MADMRYFVEVTESQAQFLEDTNSAKPVQGASGGNAGWLSVHDHSPWVLLRTTEAQALKYIRENAS